MKCFSTDFKMTFNMSFSHWQQLLRLLTFGGRVLNFLFTQCLFSTTSKDVFDMVIWCCSQSTEMTPSMNIAQAAADFLLRQQYRAEMYTHFPLRFMLTFLSLVLVSFSIANLKHSKKKKKTIVSQLTKILRVLSFYVPMGLWFIFFSWA